MTFLCRGFPHPARRTLARPPFGPSPRTAAPAACPVRCACGAFLSHRFRPPAHPAQPPPYPSGQTPRDRHVRQRSPSLHAVATMPSSAIGSGERSAWRAVPPTPTAHACTPLALRSPGHTWAAEGKATRTAARGGGEETGTRTSAQHGEGDRVGSARARVRAHRILPNFEQAQRGTECRRVANSRRGMSLPQADCRRGGGSTAAAAIPLATPSIVPHTCVGAVGTEFHRAPPGRAFELPAERDWAHPEVMRVRPRAKTARQDCYHNASPKQQKCPLTEERANPTGW